VRLERAAKALLRAAGAASDSTLGTRISIATSEGCHLMEAAAGSRSADRVAGFLCAFSLTLSGIAIARTPGLLAPVAVVIALAAARMTQAHRTLAGVAVVVSGIAFFLGMVVAITTDNALY
jgi:hypothetical protein